MPTLSRERRIQADVKFESSYFTMVEYKESDISDLILLKNTVV